MLRRLLEEWPAIKAPRLTEILRCEYGFTGSLRLVQARLQQLRPSTPPIMRPEPAAAAAPLVLPRLEVAPPELADYAELCA